MKGTKLSQRRRCQRKEDSSGEHLRAGAHDLRRRKRKFARQHRSYRPAYRSNDDGHGACRVDWRPAKVQRAAHEHSHSAYADQQRKGETDGEPLGSQEEDLRQRHEYGDRSHHDGGEAGGHALLGPEQQSVVDDEDQNSEQRDRHPLATVR